MTTARAESLSLTLPFDKFWKWLQGHANCIMRAGTPEAVLFDHEDYHWHFSQEPEENIFVVQLVRGKELVGELLVLPNDISYVQGEAGEGEEFIFECIVESKNNRHPAYHFVTAHGYEETENPGKTRWTH